MKLSLHIWSVEVLEIWSSGDLEFWKILTSELTGRSCRGEQIYIYIYIYAYIYLVSIHANTPVECHCIGSFLSVH